MAAKMKKPLGTMLVEAGKLTDEQLQEALEYQRENETYLGRALIDLQFVSSEELSQFLGDQLGIPFVRLGTYKVSEEAIDLLPDSLARKYKVLPLFEINGVLNVAVSDPLDPYSLDAIREETGLDVEPVISTLEEIENAIDLYYGMSKMIGDIDSDLLGTAGEQISLDEMTDETKIVELVDGLIKQAVKYEASDIHIESRESDIRVRLRIDGKLQEFYNVPKNLHLPLVSRLKIMSDLDIAETRKPQDGRINFSSNGGRIDLRLSTFPTFYGEKIVLRVLDIEKARLQLTQLGFDPEMLKVFESLITTGEGVILVSGPTGSGKTTTLYATLNKINRPTENIVTIEDPIEYELPNVNQAQVNPKAGVTFASALRAVLRQDPDIIMIGEIRDQETVDLATRAALTGHLVFSTIHTNDAASGFTRLLNWEVEPFLIVSTVKAILAQRLIRKLCPKCRVSYKPTSDELKKFGLDKGKEHTFFKPHGCLSCRNVGFSGRTGLFELLVTSSAISDLIISNAPPNKIKEAAIKEGMVTLRIDGIKKVMQGITSIEEITSGVSTGFAEGAGGG